MRESLLESDRLTAMEQAKLGCQSPQSDDVELLPLPPPQINHE